MTDKSPSDDTTKTGAPFSVHSSDQDYQAMQAAECEQVRIAGYRIIRKIYSGGQGVVYEAVQESTTQKVAIKIQQMRSTQSTAATKRFEREIRLVANLRHPNIVTVFDSGNTGDGNRYFVMEYIRGKSLTDHVAEHNLGLHEMLALFATVCDAVHFANEKGSVHRDLKPSNIMIDDQGVPKVLDFGLAKRIAAEPDALEPLEGFFVGSPTHASPEQLRGQSGQLDRRSDVYSLGVVLYELLTGRTPYPPTGSAKEMLRQIQQAPPTPPRQFRISPGRPANEFRPDRRVDEHAIDEDVESIVLKALAVAREQRHQHVSELADDIRNYLRGEPIPSRRDSLIYVARTRLQSMVHRHRIATAVAVALLSTILALTLVSPLILRWTAVHAYFEHFLAQYVWSPITSDAFDSVRVVALTDDSYVESLAAGAGIQSVEQSKTKSFRRLHGALMKKLAMSGCKVVAFDITFASESEHDDAFVEGVKSLRDSGKSVIVAVKNWKTKADGAPFVSKPIAEVVNWGCTLANVANSPTTLQLIAKRDSEKPEAEPSFVLATIGGIDQADSLVQYDLNTNSHSLKYYYYTRHERIPSVQNVRPGPPKRVSLTAAYRGDQEPGIFGGFSEVHGLNKKSAVGFYYIYIPTDDVLENSTIKYRDIFKADREQLRNWLAEKVVIVADYRPGVDRKDLPDGRTIGGCYTHAAAIDALMKGIVVRLPRETDAVTIPLLAALVGSFIATAMVRRGSRWGILAAIAFVTILTSLGSYRYLQYLFNPLIPLFALLLSFLLLRALARTNLRNMPL